MKVDEIIEAVRSEKDVLWLILYVEELIICIHYILKLLFSCIYFRMPEVPYKYFMTVSPLDGRLYISDYMTRQIIRIKTMGPVSGVLLKNNCAKNMFTMEVQGKTYSALGVGGRGFVSWKQPSSD